MMLKIENLSKSYRDNNAVIDLSLDIPSGEVFGLLGPNGAGKTTTLKMIPGLVVPDRGRIEVNSIDTSEDPERARAMIAYIPDEPTIYPRLSGREFLRFTGRMRDIPPDELERRIAFHEELFNMGGWIDSRAEGYSHGMVQRVVLSAAFIARPALYVIDEPHVGLDPATAETFNRMARAAAASGASVILSTHTLPVALAFCDRLGIIHEGRLMKVFRTDDIRGEDLRDIFFRITGTGPGDIADFFSGT
ncbi:MAG: ATP-binding cassette domain-containing protein [Candidatus Aegiribacteria sp.]|nr:ATP-binding cassette domain-containing protein [Candidatus Aegiribacteria sp.]